MEQQEHILTLVVVEPQVRQYEFGATSHVVKQITYVRSVTEDSTMVKFIDQKEWGE